MANVLQTLSFREPKSRLFPDLARCSRVPALSERNSCRWGKEFRYHESDKSTKIGLKQASSPNNLIFQRGLEEHLMLLLSALVANRSGPH